MHAAKRVLSLAIGLIGTALAPGAQSESLPPIFAPKPISPIEIEAKPAYARPSPSSQRTRNAILEKALARAAVFDGPTLPAASRNAGASEAVMMDRFVVQSSPIRAIELRTPDPAVLKFIKTGNLFRTVGRKVTSESNVNLLSLPYIGTQPRKFIRVEIEFNFRW